MKVYGQLEQAQAEGVSADPTAGKRGRLVWNHVGSRLKVDNGTVYREIVTTADTQTLTGKTLTGNIAVNLVSGAATVTLPTVTGTLATLAGTEALTNKDIDGGTASNTSRITLPRNTKANLDALTRKQGTIAFGTDTRLLYVDDGTTLLPAGGGGGGSAVFWLEDGATAIPSVDSSNRTYLFSAGLSQTVFALVRVPFAYLAGSQINLRITAYSADTANTYLMQSVATLIRTGTDVISSTTNQRTSSNSAITASAGNANRPQAIVLDLTSATGQINGVSVAAGDLIRIQLVRGTDTATGDVVVPVYGCEVTFS